jgi:hypothetical protein
VETQDIFLLGENQDVVSNTFRLSDYSGEWGSDTELIIEKAIKNPETGETDWEIVAGDEFGATTRFPVFLSEGERHRIILQNDERSLVVGSYIPQIDGEEVIRIKDVDIPRPAKDGYYGTVKLTEDAGETYAEFAYVDDVAGASSNLNIKIYERGNPENVVFEDQVTGTFTSETRRILLPDGANTVFIVEWSVDRNGETIGETKPLGDTGGLSLPIDPRYFGPIVIVFLVFVASLSDMQLSTEMSFVLVGAAALVMYFKWMTIDPAFWWVALIIAAGGGIVNRFGRQY